MSLKFQFKPLAGFSNKHLQTLLPVFLGKFQRVTTTRQQLVLPDGDFVDIDWLSIPNVDEIKPIVIIFHGLEGSSESHYVKALLQAVEKKSWNAVVMNFRSCSGRPNLKPCLYHSGETSDASFLIIG